MVRGAFFFEYIFKNDNTRSSSAERLSRDFVRPVYAIVLYAKQVKAIIRHGYALRFFRSPFRVHPRTEWNYGIFFVRVVELKQFKRKTYVSRNVIRIFVRGHRPILRQTKKNYVRGILARAD